MITKYTYGNPFQTDAVVQKLEVQNGDVPYFTVVKTEEQLQFEYTLENEEKVYGLGENVRGINKRGWIYKSCCADEPNHVEDRTSLYASHNFLVLDGGKEQFGVFFDYPGIITFDVGYTHLNELKITLSEPDADVYVMTGESILDIVKQFRQLIGRSYIPPKWAFGYQQSRWGYMNEADIREVVKGHREKKIPLESIYMDIDYMERFKDFTVNQERFPDFPEFVKEMKAQHIHLVPIIDAGVKVEEGYDVYEEGIEKGYFCKKENGEYFVAGVWPGKVHFPDVLNKEAREWFGNKYQVLLDQGIEGFWNDMNEPASFRGELPQDVVFHDEERTTNHAEMHNVYGHYMSRATFEGLQKLSDKRPFVITRAAYAGTQKYATVWTGDNQSLWSHLQMMVPQLCNLGMSGFAFAGTDIGGFGADTTPELLTRWIEAAVFSPLFRNHSCQGTRRQEPWQFDDQVVGIYRKYVKMRYRFLPYLYDLFYQGEQTGLPVMRPLVLHYPKDPETYNLNGEFLVGENLLVAPVLEQGATKKMVYLPEGEWYDYWTGEKITGGKYFLRDAPIDLCPMYLKEGTMIPMYEKMAYVGEKPYRTLYLLTTPGEASYDHFQDNGEDYAYRKGVYNLYHFHKNAQGVLETEMRHKNYPEYEQICLKIVGK